MIDKQEELNDIDLLISLNRLLLKADPESAEPSIYAESAREKIDALLDSRFLLMQT